MSCGYFLRLVGIGDVCSVLIGGAFCSLVLLAFI